jgi:glycosyltransferase involved in cell wall biosynthesis
MFKNREFTMKVLLVASKYPPEYSGSGKRLHDLYKRLKSKYGTLSWSVLSTRGAGVSSGIYEGVLVYRVPGARNAHKSSRNLFSKILEVLFGFREMILSLYYLKKSKFSDVDIVHTCGWSWCVIAASIWAHYRHIPLIRELTSITDHPNSPSYMRPLIRLTLRWASGIVAISPYLEKECKKVGLAKKVWCRPNPVDEMRFFPVSQEERLALRKELFPERHLKSQTTILNIGRIRPLKNPLILLEIMKRLPESHHLILVGPVSSEDKAYIEKIHQRKEALGLKERVLIRSDYHENPESFMQAADLFLFPSISEGLGSVVLEALMCGLPVVATPLEGITDSVIKEGQNGYLAFFEKRNIINIIERAFLLNTNSMTIALEAKDRFCSEKIDGQYYTYLMRTMLTQKKSTKNTLEFLFLP